MIGQPTNYCPQCGTSRQGRYCANCAFDFQPSPPLDSPSPYAFQALASTHTSNRTRYLAIIGTAIVVLALAVAAITYLSSAKTQPTAPSNEYPPVGAIWFAPSVDSATGATSSHESSFSQSQSFVAIAQLPQTITGGQRIMFTIDGTVVATVSPNSVGVNSGDMAWVVINPHSLSVGLHYFDVKDSGANVLDLGSLNITP